MPLGSPNSQNGPPAMKLPASSLQLCRRLALAPSLGGRRSLPLVQHASARTAFTDTGKLDELFPTVVDFPARHIGPRKHEAKEMLELIGYKVKKGVAESGMSSENIDLL